jgi:hypothetical protein
MSGGGCISVFIGSLLALVAVQAIGYGRGLVTPSAAEVLRRDERPPILFLRAFSDDRRELSELAGRIIVRPGQERTFEETLSRTLEACGPVVAIGRPGELIAPAGAARESLGNETWRERVKDLMAQSKLIVMLMGVIKKDVDDGLGWEVRTLFEMNMPEKTVLIAPQLPEAEVQERWNKYSEVSQGKLPLYQSGALLATFSSDWTCNVSLGSKKRRAKEDDAALLPCSTTVGSATGPFRGVRILGSLAGAVFGGLIAAAVVWFGFDLATGPIDKMGIIPRYRPPVMVVAALVGLLIGGVLGYRIKRV